MTGRGGVGRSRVAAALAGTGYVRTPDVDAAEVQVLVIAETCKPEDLDTLRSSTVPTMVVLNKADLAGADPVGPVAGSERAAAELSETVGVPVVPMIAPLAAVALSDEDMAALRVLAASAADMSSTDAFVDAPHRLPTATRAHLLQALDRFGVAHAVLAVAEGATADSVGHRLRALSQVDRVLAQLAATAAPVRYRRLRAAVDELRCLAACGGDEELAAFLSSDEVVLALMASAVDVVEGCGGTVDRGEEPDAHLRRARHWRRYADGPVSRTHQRCAADIVRGSLRLLDRTR